MSASTPNAFLNIDDAHLRVTSGNVYAQGLNISGISFSGVSGLQTVTNTGNVTTNTLEFKNGEKAFVATSNVDVKGSLDVANVATIYNGSNADYDQKQKFTSTVSASGNYFSNTLAVSTNGLYAIVGAHGEDKAYTFTRSGSTWTQENIFSSTAGSAFGYAVDISSDGTYAIVGGNGSASVFYRSSGSTWDSGTTLTAGGISVTTGYGASVSISDDGSYAIVGATGQNAAYIFRRTGTTTWDAGVKIALTGFTLGFSVAISGDGLYALLGAHAQHTAYVFKRTGAYIWSQQVKITESDSFGYSVALSTDGSRALIGATGGNGKAYSYERSGSDWSQNAIITASDATSGDAFGSAVSLSSDGSYALVGAPGNEKAYTFKNAGTVWTELGIETASDATAGHVFGRSVSISGDGIYALVGASGNEAAYSYERKETLVLDVRGEANVRTLNVSDDLIVTNNILASNNLTVAGNLNVTTIRSDSNVVAEYTGPHDRPLRKYPEVALTSASDSGYVTSSSTTVGTYYTWKAFDNNLADDSSVWTTVDNIYDSNDNYAYNSDKSLGEVDGEWLKIELPNKIKPSYVRIYPRTYVPPIGNNQSPEDFKILASNDDTNWVELVSVVGWVTNATWGKWDISSNTPYKYFAIVCTRTIGAATFGLAELEYYGYEEGSGSLDTTLKTVYNVPETTGTQLEVYYDGQDYSADTDFDQANEVLDKSGNNLHGSQNGGVGFDSTYKAFTFDGSSSQNITSSALGFTGDQPHTFSFWIKDDEMNHINTYVMHIGRTTHAASQNSSIEFRSDRIRWASYANDIEYPLTGITSNTWYHITGSYVGGGATPENKSLYINGKRFDDTGYNIFSGWEATAGDPLSFQSDAFVTLGSSTAIGTSHFNGSIANFRLYSKALNAGQVQELYDYQKDYFLGSKSQLTLYKGHLGVGVTEPSGQLELAGDERIQEYPPGPMDDDETHIPGHGVFYAYRSIFYSSSAEASSAFDKNSSTFWHSPTTYNADTGVYEGSQSLGGFTGEWIGIKIPYNIKVITISLQPRAQWSERTLHEGVLLGKNNSEDWEVVKQFSDVIFSSDTEVKYLNVDSNNYYSNYVIVITKTYAIPGTTNGRSNSVQFSNIRFFGTPGPTTLDKGSLTLGRSLDVPRVSRYDVDTETPRPEKLVVDFDTTVNSSPTDISGKGNHGTFYNDAEYSEADKAFKFDGDNDYIQTATGSNVISGSSPPFTVSVWVNNQSAGSTLATVFSIEPDAYGTNTNVWFFIQYAKPTLQFDNNYVEFYEPGTTTGGAILNRWHHIVMTFDGNSALGGRRCWLNGIEQTSSPVTGSAAGGTLTLGTTRLTLGVLYYNANYIHDMTGLISNFKLYNVALEPSEVRKLYNLGRTGRSMVISDTAVGIGKAPEAQLDVRGNISCDGVFRSENPIAFEAYYTDGTLSTTGTYLPNYVRYNYGGCYHQDTGRFYAPINGIYAFHWHAYTNQAESQSRIFIDVNGNDRGQKGNSIQHMGQQLSFSIYLNAGDYLLIKGKSSYPLYFHGYTNHNMYTGHLVIAM